MSPVTLADTTRWLVRARWLEHRCFEVLGGWVRSTPEPEVKLTFARQSHHHAWHAELFDRVVPEANGFVTDAEEDAGDAWRDFMTELAGLETTADRLVGAYALLVPGKLAEYEHWLEVSDPVRDAPLRRWLHFVVSDEQADLVEGRALLDATGATARAPRRAALEVSHRCAGPLLP
ncbi:MAG: hypothetical protein AMXMBFR46_13230 [Acidimicrobiia bacterium]